jgi:uncharacterized membrane protein YdjX (TVP38/TMEM64 family)
MSPPNVLQALRRVPGKLWLRLGILGAMVLFGFYLVLFTPVGEMFTQDRMISLLEELRHAPWTPFALVGAYIAIAPLAVIPASPLVVAGGVVFGAVKGGLLNGLGLVLGSAAGYAIARALGRDFMTHLVGPKLKRAERIFETQGFWPLVQIRYLPVPFSVVNYGAALAGVRPALFLTSSALGLLPSALIHTYFSAAMVESFSPLLGVGWFASLALLNVLTGWPSIRRALRRRERLRELRAERAARDRSESYLP